MKKKDIALALGLAACLLAAAAVLFLLPGRNDRPQSGKAGYSLAISEICAKNETIIADNGGKYRDYIELHNTGERVSLAGFCLTDGENRSEPMGDIVLEAGEYRVFFLGDDVTGFALSASGGDCVQLLDPDGHIVFQANTAACKEDQVMVLRGSSYVLTMEATPGFSNDESGRNAFLRGDLDETPTLLIHEVLSGNVSSLPNGSGEFSDVVELYNGSGEPVSLGRFFLSDDGGNRFRFRLPERTLAPGEYVLIFCDGGSGTDGEIHANFALSHGETLYLTENSGLYSALEISYVGDDVSQAYTADGYVVSDVSLGYPNTQEGAYAFLQSRMDPEAAIIISEVLLSSAGIPWQGQFPDVVEVTNRGTEAVSTAGWYLSDGGDPRAYALPEGTLQPGETMVIPCGPATTGFSLSEGETVVLTGPELYFASRVSCVAQAGMSLSVLEDGYTFTPVSLGAADHQAYLENTMPAGLRISELISANRSYLKGPYGTTCDWIELYNGSDADIDLSQYCLTDDPDVPAQHPLPDVILAPGEYCVILLTELTQNLPSGYATLPMGLSAQGEQIYLMKNGVAEDYVLLPELDADASWGRPTGESGFAVLAQVTPGGENGEAAMVCAMPVAVTPQGIYNAVEHVDVVLEGEGDIYYTTDCTVPGVKATLYTGPIRLTETTALRVVCRGEGKSASNVLDLTYVINEMDPIDVVCLVTDPDNLFDTYTGIYVPGPGDLGEFPHRSANYWRDWEKPATVTLFAQDGSGFSVPCGIRIHGAFSRALDKKSLAVMFRGEYGCSELAYPLFEGEGPDTYEAFVLRSGGQDAFMARMRDVLITSLADQYTDLAVQRYRPVVVYINGQYWGLHYVREKISEHYVAGNYNADASTVVLAEGNGGASREYLDLVSYAARHDLNKQEHYDYICSQMDVEQYADYIITQICIANMDNSNVKFFKTPEGKWTWILYDTDLAFRDASFNSVAGHLNPEGTGAVGSLRTTLINALLKRTEFKEWFLRRLAWQMTTIWSQESIEARIDELENTINAVMVKDCKRWKVSYEDWQSHVRSLRRFAGWREEYMLQDIKNYFGLSASQMREYGFPV